MPQETERLAAVRVMARLSRFVERGTGELSLAHYRVLAAVAEGDERASRVAARLTLGKPTISASVEALCRRGLLTRDQASDDQRAATLTLTAAGKTALAEVEDGLVTRMGALLDRTSDPGAVMTALAQLGVGLDALMDERLAARGVAL
jgi:DNA-binding MarR family transcriptional regulator